MTRVAPGFDHRIADWLEADPSMAPAEILSTVVAALPSIPQARRGPLAPWRFPNMPALSRATGIAAVALAAVVGAGGLVYVNSNAPGSGSGSTPAPTDAPTTAPTPQPSFPGISGWKTYTSAVYGYTISYPEDWSVVDRATEKWQPGASEDDPFQDVFFNNAPATGRDDSMVFVALQIPAPPGADLASWDGLLTALTEMCAKPAQFNLDACPSENQVTRLCLESQGCQPVALLHGTDERPRALFGDPATGMVTYIHVGRADDFPGAARYGGTVMLLKSILSQLGVREPLPEETAN